MTPASMDAPAENAAGSVEPRSSGAPRSEASAAGVGRVEATLAGAGDHLSARSAEPSPPSGLPLELTGPASEAGTNGSISEFELMALLGDAYQADTWPEMQAPDLAAPPTPSSAMADHAAGNGHAPPGGDDPSPRFPPPDTEPAAAKEPERQLGQAEIDALLAQLLGS
jgi:hypothetical protein